MQDTLLLYADLDVNNSNFPQEYDNLSKSSYIPSVQGGILWADIVNKLFYLFGGEYYQTPTEPFALWQYDVIYNTWNATNSDTSGVSRVSFGAGAVVDDRAIGFYYGGWLSNNSVPGWAGIPMATSNLVQYDMLTSTWYNYTGPDSNGRAEGVMLYIPASDAGMLVYFGGIVQTPSAVNNGSWVGVSDARTSNGEMMANEGLKGSDECPSKCPLYLIAFANLTSKYTCTTSPMRSGILKQLPATYPTCAAGSVLA